MKIVKKKKKDNILSYEETSASEIYQAYTIHHQSNARIPPELEAIYCGGDELKIYGDHFHDAESTPFN